MQRFLIVKQQNFQLTSGAAIIETSFKTLLRDETIGKRLVDGAAGILALIIEAVGPSTNVARI